MPHDPALNFGTGDFTVDLWAYFNDTDGEQVLIEKWVQGNPKLGWTLTKLYNNVLRLAVASFPSPSSDGNEIDIDSDVLSIPPGTWNHFAVTRQGDHFTVFMNGKPIATGSAPYDLDTVSSLKFGHRGNPYDTPGSTSHQEYYLNGLIDEVEVFVGRALPPGQIRAIYEAGNAGKCKGDRQGPENSGA